MQDLDESVVEALPPGRGGGTASYAGFVVDGGEVLPHGPFGDPETSPDLVVGPALGSKGENFTFPTGWYVVTAEANGRIQGPSTSGNDLWLARPRAGAVP